MLQYRYSWIKMGKRTVNKVGKQRQEKNRTGEGGITAELVTFPRVNPLAYTENVINIWVSPLPALWRAPPPKIRLGEESTDIQSRTFWGSCSSFCTDGFSGSISCQRVQEQTAINLAQRWLLCTVAWAEIFHFIFIYHLQLAAAIPESQHQSP